MKLIRAKSTDAIDFIKPKLTIPQALQEQLGVQARDFYADNLKGVMENFPPKLLQLDIAIDGDELLGFTLSHVNNQLQPPIAILAQVWTKNRGVSEVLFERVVDWARGLGFTKIYAETQRLLNITEDTIHKFWGFKVVSQTIMYDIEAHDAEPKQEQKQEQEGDLDG